MSHNSEWRVCNSTLDLETGDKVSTVFETVSLREAILVGDKNGLEIAVSHLVRRINETDDERSSRLERTERAAHLISSAPDLLAALDGLLAHHVVYESRSDTLQDRIEFARSAIRKARGEE